MQKVFLYLAFAGTLAGCGSKDKTPPRPSFTGKVQLVDEFGAKQGNSSGVQISADGTSSSPTTQSAADGTYSLAGLADGDHQLSFIKSGYATSQLHPVTASATQATAVADVVLSPVSTTTTLLNPIQKVGSQYVVSGYVNPKPTLTQPRFHRLYLQRYDGVIPVKRPAERNYDLTLGGPVGADGSFTDTLTISQLYAAKIGYGSDVLVWATGDNPAATPFRDLTTDVLVYPAAVPTKQLVYGKFSIY